MNVKTVQNIILISLAMGVAALTVAIAIGKKQDLDNFGNIKNGRDVLEQILKYKTECDALRNKLSECEKNYETNKIKLAVHEKYVFDVLNIIEDKKIPTSANKIIWSADHANNVKSMIASIQINNQKSAGIISRMRGVISSIQINNQEILIAASEAKQILDANNDYLNSMNLFMDKYIQEIKKQN
jgi:hypothetical protein